MPLSYEDPIQEPIFKFIPDKGFYPIAFRIFYTDGFIYEFKGNLKELKDAWDQALNTGVQLIVVYIDDIDATGNYLRQFIQGYDYYSFDGEYFYGSNDSRGTPGTILYGEWTTDEEFEQIRQDALDTHETPSEKGEL